MYTGRDRRGYEARRIGRAAMKLAIAVGVVLLLLAAKGTALRSPAIAQEPTPAPQQASRGPDEGFFSDIRLGDVLAGITTVGVAVLGFWLFRVQGARLDLLKQQAQSARDTLDDQRKRSAEEIANQHSHNERLRQQHEMAERILERQLEDEKRKVGIDPSGQITAERIEMPEEVRTNVAEILGLLRQMRLERAHVEITTVPSPEAIAQEHLDQGNTYFAVGDYEQAITEYTRALEMQPDDPVISFNRGVTLGHLGRYEDSLADLNRSLQLRPDAPLTLANRGATLRSLGLARYGEALADLNSALEILRYDFDGTIKRDYVVSVLYSRARLLSLWNRTDKAMEDLGRVIEADLRRPIAARNEYREMARTEPDFHNIRSDPRFRELVGEAEPPADAEKRD